MLFVAKFNYHPVELSKISALYVAIARDKRIGTLIGSLFWPTLYLYQCDLCQPPLRGFNTNKIIFNLSPDADVGGKIDTPDIGGGFGFGGGIGGGADIDVGGKIDTPEIGGGFEMGVGIDMGADIDMPETDIKVKAEAPDFG